MLTGGLDGCVGAGLPLPPSTGGGPLWSMIAAGSSIGSSWNSLSLVRRPVRFRFLASRFDLGSGVTLFTDCLAIVFSFLFIALWLWEYHDRCQASDISY